MGTNHQDASQILVALFRDRPELLFAAGRILPRHETNPSRKVTTRSECPRVRDSGGNGGRAHNTNPRDALGAGAVHHIRNGLSALQQIRVI
jgi:hypothetical protein